MSVRVPLALLVCVVMVSCGGNAAAPPEEQPSPAVSIGRLSQDIAALEGAQAAQPATDGVKCVDARETEPADVPPRGVFAICTTGESHAEYQIQATPDGRYKARRIHGPGPKVIDPCCGE